LQISPLGQSVVCQVFYRYSVNEFRVVLSSK